MVSATCIMTDRFSSRTLRDAFGLFATGVTVITTCDANAQPVGVTANSFTSVSLNPPLLSFCLDRGAYSAAHFATAEKFAVNILGENQMDLSADFANPQRSDWSRIAYDLGPHGLPLIAHSLGSFECRRYAAYDGGDHIIYVGEILELRINRDGSPLIYYQGRYRRLSSGE